MEIASALDFGQRQLIEIGAAAFLHNYGMLMVPKGVLNTPRKLSPAEFIDIQKAVPYCLHAISKYSGLPLTTRRVAYQAKERADGTGYLKRRPLKFIHTFAQIISVAEVYDALTTRRPWREALHPHRAMEHLLHQANKKKFDAKLIRGLLRYLSLFPIGTLVRLTSGEVAKVIHSNGDAFDRPVVNVLFDQNGHRLAEPITVDFLKEDEPRVASVVEEYLAVGINDVF